MPKMMDSMYDEGSDPSPASAPAGKTDDGSENEGADEQKKENGEGKTALLPKDICPDMKPGDEMVLKIERVLDDQYEVSYSPEPKTESGSEEPSEEGQSKEQSGPPGSSNYE